MMSMKHNTREEEKTLARTVKKIENLLEITDIGKHFI